MAPISTALCSIGMSGTVFHAPFLTTHPGFRLTAVWERSKNIAAEKYPGVTTYRDYHEMLADDSVELVVVNTPNITHYELTKTALMSGKHVLVEKPFTSTVAECRELMDLAQEKNVVLTVFHNRRYDSDFLTVQKIIREGKLGDVREAEFHFDRFDNNLSYKLHKETPVKGTGCLYDLGSHLIDQALVLFGMPDAVFADIFAMRPASEVDDYFELLLYYSGFRVRLKASYQVREALPGYILHGSKGSFIKPKADVQEKDLQAGKLPNSENWGIEPEEFSGILNTEVDALFRGTIPTERGNYNLFFDSLYQSVRNMQPMAVTAEQATSVIEIIEAAFESNLQKKVMSFKKLA